MPIRCSLEVERDVVAFVLTQGHLEVRTEGVGSRIPSCTPRNRAGADC